MLHLLHLLPSVTIHTIELFRRREFWIDYQQPSTIRIAIGWWMVYVSKRKTHPIQVQDEQGPSTNPD